MSAAPTGIEAFFEPRGVAVIGASRSAGKAGYQQVLNLKRGYRGGLYPVNPKATDVCGVPAFASLDDIPGPVDLAIVLLPAELVPEAVGASVARKVPAVLIASAGFAEAGARGRQLQDQCLALSSGTGTRLWGPNCNGLVNTDNNLLASFVDLPLVRKGGVAIVSQTGIFAAAFLNQLMEQEGFGVSKVATLGNAADVDALAVLEYLAGDPATTSIALHLEGVRDGARFVRFCRELTRQKPIVALAAGQTAAGARASLSHTANLAAEGRIMRGALRQAGIIEAADFTDLVEMADGLATLGSCGVARRVAVMTTTGGAGVVAADRIARAGLDLAVLSPGAEQTLANLEPMTAGAANPLDIWPAMQRHGTEKAVAEIAGTVMADPAVDAGLLIMGAFSGGGQDFDPACLAPAVALHRKPISAWLYGPQQYLGPWSRGLRQLGVPACREIGTAVALLAAIDRIALSRRHRTVRSCASAFDIETAAHVLADARQRGETVLTEPSAHRFLRSLGIASPLSKLAKDSDAAVIAARRLGPSVALKIVSPHIMHKTDVGGVVTGVRGDEEVRAACQRIRAAVAHARPDAPIEGILVQEMVTNGREVVVGLTTTPQFGQVLMVGLGGILVESIAQVAFGVSPIDTTDAERMIEESGVGQLLDSHRGGPAGDRVALVEILIRLSDLTEAGLGIEQMEINPLLVLDIEKGARAVDAVVVLRQ